MGSMSGLGIGLSSVFGCILLAVVVGELWYLLWLKKRITNGDTEAHYTNHVKEVFYLLCWKRDCSVNINSSTQDVINSSVRHSDVNGLEPDLELGSAGKDVLLNGFGEEDVESELRRLHSLHGPPGFLFTIMEETWQDLESRDGTSGGDRSREWSVGRSMSDLTVGVETPFFTPSSSPTLKTETSHSYDHHGFSPLFESSTEAELNRLRSSPPPKFKFLRDAEDKLMRNLMEETEKDFRNGRSV